MTIRKFIPYGRQAIDQSDIDQVTEVLNSDWLTTGPKVAEFEEKFADFVGVGYAVAVSSGTAALHCAMYAIGIKKGDEVIVPPMTFAASANAILFQGGTPIFTDVEQGTLLIDPAKIEEKITDRTRAIVAVDYAGHPCDWDALRLIADKYDLYLVDDGCHALGAKYKGRRVGQIADVTVFSFHPTKHITTGEGGMIATHNKGYDKKIRLFRNHGLTREPSQVNHFRQKSQNAMHNALCNVPWYYAMADLGFNYRLTDIQSAFGISQLNKLPGFIKRRQEIARMYDDAFATIPGISPLEVKPEVKHTYHLYVIRVERKERGNNRLSLFEKMREKGIGINVHYIPVHLHPYYCEKLGTGDGLCPVAEKEYEKIISLPIFPEMTNEEVEYVVETIRCVKNTG